MISQILYFKTLYFLRIIFMIKLDISPDKFRNEFQRALLHK